MIYCFHSLMMIIVISSLHLLRYSPIFSVLFMRQDDIIRFRFTESSMIVARPPPGSSSIIARCASPLLRRLIVGWHLFSCSPQALHYRRPCRSGLVWASLYHFCAADAEDFATYDADELYITFSAEKAGEVWPCHYGHDFIHARFHFAFQAAKGKGFFRRHWLLDVAAAGVFEFQEYFIWVKAGSHAWLLTISPWFSL